MDEAIVVFSRKGIFQTTITARDVRSREHARKLWPLVSPDASRQMVTWVSPSALFVRLDRCEGIMFPVAGTCGDLFFCP
jgi:hypothetical protein